MNPKNFFSELKRRNVYKVAVAYAVVAWLLIQAASILFTIFEAPSWAMKVFVVVIVLGFPAALIFSWAFEFTPEGIKRDSEVAPIGIHSGPVNEITEEIVIVHFDMFNFQKLCEEKSK
jgi:adenylate cyclase